MKSIEKEVKLEIKHHVPIIKKVKAIQDYSLNISTLQELAEELGVGTQTILNWVDNSKKITALCYIYYSTENAPPLHGWSTTNIAKSSTKYSVEHRFCKICYWFSPFLMFVNPTLIEILLLTILSTKELSSVFSPNLLNHSFSLYKVQNIVE